MALTPDQIELLAITAYHARKQALFELRNWQLSTREEWDALDEESKEVYRQEVAAVIAVYEDEMQWDRTFASPEGQAVLAKLAAKAKDN